MSTSQSTIDFLLDQLTGCGPVTTRKMFGEYCLYFAGKPIGLVCDDQLFLKNTQALRAVLPHPVEGAPYPRAKPHLLISADDWDDRHSLCQWVRVTVDALDALSSAKPAALRQSPASRLKNEKKVVRAVTDLPNLGPKSKQMLETAGIRTVAQLRKLGSVAAYARVKQSNASVSLNLLWALEGALTDLPWQEVAREHRTSLLLALEQLRETSPSEKS
jgi:DNA transformation protein